MKIKVSIFLLLFCATILTACSAPAKKFGDVTILTKTISPKEVASGNLISGNSIGYMITYNTDYSDISIPYHPSKALSIQMPIRDMKRSLV